MVAYTIYEKKREWEQPQIESDCEKIKNNFKMFSCSKSLQYASKAAIYLLMDPFIFYFFILQNQHRWN